MLTVFNRTHMLVRLREGRAWAAQPGPLYVVGMDSGAGPYEGFKPAAVAHVVPDADSHPSGVEVQRTNSQVLYQTPAIRHLEIHGTSLSVDAQLTFSPPLTKGVDYKVLRATSDVMVLGLLAGKMWRQTAGQLMLMSVDTGSGPVEMAHGTGIVVADVSANPTVATSTARITTSTTRRLSIYGTGFAIDGTELTLEPTSRAAYDVEAVYENEVVLRLREGKSWAALGSAESMPLVVTKIDTAAGEYIFQDSNGKPAPVTVALVVPDSAATTASGDVMRCDDTCMWANDGVCDDGSQGARTKKDQDKGGAWWEDDDLGAGTRTSSPRISATSTTTATTMMTRTATTATTRPCRRACAARTARTAAGRWSSWAATTTPPARPNPWATGTTTSGSTMIARSGGTTTTTSARTGTASRTTSPARSALFRVSNRRKR